jgi:hypothetical protein
MPLYYPRLKPPSPYITIDTLKIASKYFAFPSNKLTDVGTFLKIGKKLQHTGIALWFDCMRPQINKRAWAMMKEASEPVVVRARAQVSGLPVVRSVPQRLSLPEIRRQAAHHVPSHTPGSVIRHDSFAWWE